MSSRFAPGALMPAEPLDAFLAASCAALFEVSARGAFVVFPFETAAFTGCSTLVALVGVFADFAVEEDFLGLPFAFTAEPLVFFRSAGLATFLLLGDFGMSRMLARILRER